MIEKLGPQRGAWDEDTVRIIEKVNEIVDVLNGKEEEKVKEKVNTTIKKGDEKTSAKGALEKGGIESKQKRQSKDTKKDEQNYR